MAGAGIIGEISLSPSLDLDLSKHTQNVRNNALTLDFSNTIPPATNTPDTKTIGLIAGGVLLLGGIIYLVT